MSALPAEVDWLLGAKSSSVRDFYADIGVDLPDRGGEELMVSCFANPAGHSRGDRRPSCSVNMITGLWHCKGCGEKGNAYAAALATGMRERQAGDLAKRHDLFVEGRGGKAERSKLPGERDLKKWRHELWERQPRLLNRLWEVKAWTARGIARCGVGWDGERLTMPHRSAKGKVIGVARYLPNGDPKMISVPGSKREFFPRPELVSRDATLFLVEGEPAAVTLWSHGLYSVSVPGTSGFSIDLFRRLSGRKVIMLPDCDPQGRELAYHASRVFPQVRVVDLDSSRDDGWDVGDLFVEAAPDGGCGAVAQMLGRLAA